MKEPSSIAGRRQRLPQRSPSADPPRQGLAKAKASVKKIGRPKGSLGTSRLDGREDEFGKLLDLGVSKSALAKIIGVSRTTLYNFLCTRGVQTTSPPRGQRKACDWARRTSSTVSGCHLCTCSSAIDSSRMNSRRTWRGQSLKSRVRRPTFSSIRARIGTMDAALIPASALSPRSFKTVTVASGIRKHPRQKTQNPACPAIAGRPVEDLRCESAPGSRQAPCCSTPLQSTATPAHAASAASTPPPLGS